MVAGGADVDADMEGRTAAHSEDERIEMAWAQLVDIHAAMAGKACLAFLTRPLANLHHVTPI